MQIAEEWATARGEAARAKGAGDKPRQKAAGQVIAGLKREIAQLGESHKAVHHKYVLPSRNDKPLQQYHGGDYASGCQAGKHSAWIMSGYMRSITRVFVHPAGLTEAAIEALAERFTVKSAPVTPAEDVEEWPDLGALSNAGRGAQAGQHPLVLCSMSGRHFLAAMQASILFLWQHTAALVPQHMLCRQCDMASLYSFLLSAGEKNASVAAESGRQHDAFPPLSRDQGTASGTGGFMDEAGLQNDEASVSASAHAARLPSHGTDQQAEVVMLPCHQLCTCNCTVLILMVPQVDTSSAGPGKCYQHCAFEPQVSRSASELSLGAKEEQKQASRGAEEDEDIDIGPGMFDEDAAELMSAGASAAAKSIADMVMPWGGYSGAKKKSSKLKSKPPCIPCIHAPIFATYKVHSHCKVLCHSCVAAIIFTMMRGNMIMHSHYAWPSAHSSLP